MNVDGPASQPLVTVIMCVYNGGEYLRPAVESVLAQTYGNIELLVIDDGSTDGCFETIADLRDPRIRIIRQANRGKPTAMNVALDAMRGDFYVLNDADDLSHPKRVQRQLDCLLNNPDVAAVFTGYDLILDGAHVAPRTRAKDRVECRRDIAALRMPSHDPTAMFRCSAVKDLRYDTESRIAEGYDYVLRVGEAHPMLVIGECLYSYRVHLQSITRSDPEAKERAVCHVISRACQRRGMPFDETALPWLVRKPGRHERADNNLAADFMESVLDQRRAGRRISAVRTGLQCSRLHPFDPHYHKALIYAVVPERVIPYLRRSAT